MRQLLIPAILCTSYVSFASADEVDVVVKKSQTKKSESKAARIIIIQTDGKKHEFRLGKDKIDAKVLKGLPKNIQIRIKKAIADHADKGQGKGKGKRTIKATVHAHGKDGTVHTHGKVVIVGPDGKRREIEFDGKSIDEKVLKGLPKNIRIRIQNALKGQPGKGKVIRKTHGKAIIIGADGKKKEFKIGVGGFGPKGADLKGLPKEIRLKIEQAMKAHGGKGAFKFNAPNTRIGIFIGPDGKKHEFRMNSKNINLHGINPAFLKQMSKEDREKFFKALHGAGFTAQKNLKVEVTRAGSKSGTDKLDLILQRLDSLEKQIQDLRKKVDK